MMGAELVLSFIVGGFMAHWVYKTKNTYNNAALYWSSQVLSVSLFIIPALAAVSVIIGVLLFSVNI